MEPAKILFQASDDQRLVSTASQSTLNLFAHHEILGIEHVCVNQFKRAPPVLFGLLLCRNLRNQHCVHEQRLFSGVGVHAQVADVIGVIDKDAVRKNEMHQRRVPLWAPGLGRKGADLRCGITSGQEAQMAAYGVAHRYCVGEKGAERSRMQTPDVVNLEESVDDQLPIGGASNRVLTIETMMHKPDRIEIPIELTKVTSDIERAVGGRSSFAQIKPCRTVDGSSLNPRKWRSRSGKASGAGRQAIHRGDRSR